MAKACPQCGFQMPELAAFCPGCGLRMIVPSVDEARASGHGNILGALAYVALIPAVVFLLIEPYKRDRFVRFHAIQSLFLAGTGVAVLVVLRLAFSLLSLIPWLGYLMAWLFVAVVFMGWGILWIVLLIKALQGEFFPLPWLGAWAERI